MWYSLLMIFGKRNIYMDHASSTPIDRSVLLSIRDTLDFFANPGSIHKLGVEVKNKINEARSSIAKNIGAHSDEVVFTGSATESISLAILGTVNRLKEVGLPSTVPHILTTNIEHKAVLLNLKMLESIGLVKVSYVPVDQNGILNIKSLKDYLCEDTVLVTIGYANSEIGVIQNIEDISREIRRLKKQKFFKIDGYPYIHTDATQAMNYLFTKNVEKLGVDMMSFNGSKIYGPRGIGVLYKKRGIDLATIYGGGGQEFGLRSGTENVQAIIGLSKALDIAEKLKDIESVRLQKLRDLFIDRLKDVEKETKFKIIVNGDLENRLPNNINISISGISGELVVIELDAKGIFISTKSACSVNSDEVSHVISALRKENLDSLRFSFGRNTKEKDILYTIHTLKKILLKYKNML